jgi:hypothetical protein
MMDMSDGEMPELKVVEKDETKKDHDKVTLGKLAMYAETGVLSRLGAAELKASSSLLVAKFMRTCQQQLQDREDQRKKLRQKYGEKDPTSDQADSWVVISISQGGDPEKWVGYRTEVIDLDEVVADLTGHEFRIRDLRLADKEANVPGVVIQMLMDLKVFKE